MRARFSVLQFRSPSRRPLTLELVAGPSWAFSVYGASSRGRFADTERVNMVDALG